MSANSSEGPGLDGKWFEEEEEKNGMFGSAGPRFDEMRDDLHAPKQQFHPFEGSGVAMETASTGDSLSDMFMKSSSGEGDLYTSLLSSKSSSNPFNDGASLFSTEVSESTNQSCRQCKKPTRRWRSLSLQIRSLSMWIRLSCTSTPP
uniref:Reticulon-1-A-like n=1 Tax=Sinocyclocheilus rhinocerous TaxID=307959 RepID=A0A673JGQ9_9TELE